MDQGKDRISEHQDKVEEQDRRAKKKRKIRRKVPARHGGTGF